MDKLKVCVDLSDAFENRLFGLYNANRERKENLMNDNYREIIGSDMLTEQLLIDSKNQADFNKLLFANKDSKNKLLELAMQIDKFWSKGKKLRVKFLGGTTYLQQNVITYAKKWEKFANIDFVFVTTGDAEIRVAFMTGKGSWSYVGTDALNIVDQSEPTMNFGWFDDTTTAFEFSRTVTHEFGHCLGCIHEHQSPDADINWDKQAVYDYYSKTQTPPWDKATVDRNIFQKYGPDDVTNSSFDKKSIMLYPIPSKFTTDGFAVGMNNMISRKDGLFISKHYPRP